MFVAPAPSIAHRHRRRRVGAAVAVALTAAVSVLAGCGATNTASHSDSLVRYALPPQFTPNWILPIGTAAHLNTNNLAISSTLWEDLIAYDGSTGRVTWNKKASIAQSADFAADNRSVTITLADRHWSDGQPVTASDIQFWYQVIRAEKKQWASYTPGQIPDNLTSMRIESPRRFTFTFDRAYNRQWMLANELSEIIPMPRHAWDRTSASAPAGSAADTVAGARKVWDYLNGAATHIEGYATDPLWKTIDGPYRITTFTNNGNVTLSLNKHYDGRQPGHVPRIDLIPFTSGDAEVNAVRSGSVDYGYIDPDDLAEKQSFVAEGYRIEPWTGWAITYLPYNFQNPTMGPVFRQLYARQAIQMTVDQKGLSRVIFSDSATPGYGPVPQAQSSSFVSSVQRQNPYPYDVKRARSLLEAHGWTMHGGQLRCTDPGTGASQCGAGVAQGTAFAMTVLSQSGSTVTDNMMSVLQSSMDEAGIKLSIHEAPVNTVLAQTPPCTPKQALCKWQLSFFGTAGSWYFTAYPTGEALFQTKGSANFGSYSDPAVDKLIAATTTSSSPSAITTYSAAVAKALPVIWLPSPDYQISVVKKGLTGFRQDSLAVFHPSQWRWSTS